MRRGIDISVVIPTVDSSGRITHTICEVIKALRRMRRDGLINRFEVLPVAQTSFDGTFAELHLWEKNRVVRPFFLKLRGKGVACSFGICHARYDWVLTYDDDGCYPLSFLYDAVRLCGEYDIIVASRVGRVAMPLSRRIASWGYRRVASVLLDIGTVADPQSGEKLIRRGIVCFKGHDSWERCGLVHLVERGYVWDSELLSKAKALCFKVAEVPIVFTYRENVLKVSRAWFEMGVDLFRLWRRRFL